MACSLLAVTFSAVDPQRVASFWSEILSREPVHLGEGVLLPGSETQIGLRFVQLGRADVGDRRLHLHLTSADSSDHDRIVEMARHLGASDLDVGQRPEEGHIVLADPDGNAFCIIEPDNRFLSGCGFLGEVACEGTRRLGQFWAAALEWPLVWDQDEETAIQAPAGGTKVAWGGPPLTTKDSRNAQRFDLVARANELEVEIERLVKLGATSNGQVEANEVELVDPDGNEFRLTVGSP